MTEPLPVDAQAAEDAAFQRLRRKLSDQAVEPLANRPSTARAILVAVAGLALTVMLIRQAGDFREVTSILSERSGRLVAFLIITNVYLLFKAFALVVAGRGCAVPISSWRAVRVFAESSLVGLVVAKIAADVYKYSALGDASPSARVRTVLVYRIAAIIAVLMLSALVSVMWAERMPYGALVWLVPAAVIAAIVVCFRSRVTTWLKEHGRIVVRVLPFALGALIAKIAGLSVLLGPSMDGSVVQIAAAFLVIGSLASMTQVPAGLGTLDAGYAVFLTKYLGASGGETAAFLISLRLLGPFYVGCLGALSLGGAAWSRFRTARRAIAEPLPQATGQ